MHEVEINLNSGKVLLKIFASLFFIFIVLGTAAGSLSYFLHEKLGIGENAVEKAENIIQFDLPGDIKGVFYINTGNVQVAAVQNAESFSDAQILIIASRSNNREEMEQKIQEYSEENSEKILRVFSLIQEFFMTYTYDFTVHIAFYQVFFDLRSGQFPILFIIINARIVNI